MTPGRGIPAGCVLIAHLCPISSLLALAIRALRSGTYATNHATGTSRRERLDTPIGSHFAKRTSKGRFKEMDNVGRSSKGDRRTKAKRAVTSGHGDQGDRKR
jgi:hypothetical protein